MQRVYQATKVQENITSQRIDLSMCKLTMIDQRLLIMGASQASEFTSFSSSSRPRLSSRSAVTLARLFALVSFNSVSSFQKILPSKVRILRTSPLWSILKHFSGGDIPERRRVIGQKRRIRSWSRMRYFASLGCFRSLKSRGRSVKRRRNSRRGCIRRRGRQTFRRRRHHAVIWCRRHIRYIARLAHSLYERL